MDTNILTVNEEIEYRKVLRDKVLSGVRLTQEEQFWIKTHRLYNSNLGYPYINSDIISLPENKECRIIVRIESKEYPERMFPCFEVPAGKGNITTQHECVDYRGKKRKQGIKMLVCTLNNGEETSFTYLSELGMISVLFDCYEKKYGGIVGEMSSTAHDRSMLREDIDNTHIVYHCCSPGLQDFESMVFSVSIEPI